MIDDNEIQMKFGYYTSLEAFFQIFAFYNYEKLYLNLMIVDKNCTFTLSNHHVCYEILAQHAVICVKYSAKEHIAL